MELSRGYIIKTLRLVFVVCFEPQTTKDYIKPLSIIWNYDSTCLCQSIFSIWDNKKSHQLLTEHEPVTTSCLNCYKPLWLVGIKRANKLEYPSGSMFVCLFVCMFVRPFFVSGKKIASKGFRSVLTNIEFHSLLILKRSAKHKHSQALFLSPLSLSLCISLSLSLCLSRSLSVFLSLSLCLSQALFLSFSFSLFMSLSVSFCLCL